MTRYAFVDDIELAISRAIERTAATESELSFLRELMELSAGVIEEVDESGNQVDRMAYRPYYVSAALLEQRLSVQKLSSANGVDFTGFERPINSLRCQQRAADGAFDIIVSPYYQAVCLVMNDKGKLVQSTDPVAGAVAGGDAAAAGGDAAASTDHSYPTTTTSPRRRVF